MLLQAVYHLSLVCLTSSGSTLLLPGDKQLCYDMLAHHVAHSNTCALQ
jgi:hypothetical protein